MQIGIIVSVVVAIVLTIWNVSKLLDNGAARLLLYVLPALILLIFAIFLRGRVPLERNGVFGFLIYLLISSLAVIYNSSFGWFSIRDMLIIGGYLSVFIVLFSAPRIAADAVLVFCVIGTISAALFQGISSNFSILNPQGEQLLESVVSFPAGMVMLYYIGQRQWWRGLLAFVLFVLAFKRIAFLGVGCVLGLELAMYFLFRRHVGQIVSTLIVVAISIIALYSVQIFELMATLRNEIGTSGNAVSLGRSDIAVRLWDLIDQAKFGHSLFGFGPGAADEVLHVSADILISNPHNDWLKIVFDYGFIGFVGMHVVLRLIHPNTNLGNTLYIYLTILMTTGNPLIYTYYFVTLFLIVNISPKLKETPIGYPRITTGRQIYG